MQSKWSNLKPEALALRKNGFSIRDIESRLGISRSTLSGWFKDVILTKEQNRVLQENHSGALVQARKAAAQWHNQEKQKRLNFAEKEAKSTLNKIGFFSDEILELALSLLYLGEGSKKNCNTGMGNSDPLILKFFISVLKKVYKIQTKQIKASLHLRSDQDEHALKEYWSEELSIPIENFGKSSFDKRTINSKIYQHYKGVCMLTCGSVAIQRKLVYISRRFCEKISQ